MSFARGGGQHGAGPPKKQSAGGKRSPSQRTKRILAEVAFTLLVVLTASFVLKTFIIQSFWIPSGSMETTLEQQDRVVVTKLAPQVLSIHRGDIVVFHDPGGWGTHVAAVADRGAVQSWILGITQALGLAPTSSEEYLIKRVIGLPGDHVQCAGDGAPIEVNGVALNETYLQGGMAPSNEAFDVKVPDGAFWAMGDNRSGSYDSRGHQDQELRGAVPIDKVVGVAQLRTWPLSRFGVMRNPGDVFRDVPEP
ncbi:MAG: signal peptidase I [Micrococcales bacterium]|nr:signal peptidase I [Micrococcales bacterium]